MARRLDGVGERADDDLVLRERGEGRDVFGERLAGHGWDIAVQQAGGDEELLYSRDAADFVEVGHVVFAAGREVGDEGDFVAHALDVGQGEGHVGGGGHGEEVHDAVGAAAQGHGHDHGVFE